MGHPNTKKHKANHCGYKKKPSLREVNALMGLYGDTSRDALSLSKKVSLKIIMRDNPGTQLKLF